MSLGAYAFIMHPRRSCHRFHPRRRFLNQLGCAGVLCLNAMRETATVSGGLFDSTVQEGGIWQGDDWGGWMTMDGGNVPANWERESGVIHLRASPQRTGHIVTRDEFGDFTLTFDWKIAPGGNSGIKYRVQRYDDRLLGCEYQIYDAAGREVDPKNRTGAIYDLYAADETIKPHPAGEWNRGKISLHENRIEHWLNDRIIVTATIGDDEWERRIMASKFNDVPQFAKNPQGRIMLTDHGSEVWYRNLDFREG